VGTGSGLDAVKKIKILSPCRKSIPGRPPRSLVTILTELYVFFALAGTVNITFVPYDKQDTFATGLAETVVKIMQIYYYYYYYYYYLGCLVTFCKLQSLQLSNEIERWS
jgi:hypothetical protein